MQSLGPSPRGSARRAAVSVDALLMATVAMVAVMGPGCGTGQVAPDGGGDGDKAPGSVLDVTGTGGSGLPRSDAGTGGDPIPMCDRFDQFGCGAGQKCAIVIRRAPGEQQFAVYNGCVDVFKERGEGAPCLQWSVEYKAAGLLDEVLLDPCEQGLLCAPDAEVPGLFSCQRSCQSGRYQGLPGQLCGEAGQYCGASGAESNPYLEVCTQSAGCDPTDAAACGEERGCFVRSGDRPDEALSECYPIFPPSVPDGEPCDFINDCSPGSVCWGPVRVPPARWQEGDVQCRHTCVPSDADADAGADDAGVDAGDTGCPLGQTCVAFGESGLELGTIDANFGLCE